MKQQLFTLAILLVSLQTFAQIKFEPGFFINNEGVKTECLIKNIDWRNNPEEFKYKENEAADPQTATIASVQEFSINKGRKFQRHIVDIDKSSNSLEQMSYQREPEFEKDTLFLEVLIEGKANLYYHKHESVRFFYNLENDKPTQLVYKEYRIRMEGTKDNLGENIQFKSQLWKNVNCGELSTKEVFETDYKKKSLVKYFVNYNECSKSPFEDYSKKQKRNKFNLNIRPGIKYSTLSIYRSTSLPKETNLGPKITFRGGLELEYILPYNRNKWAIIFEPTFQYFKDEKITDNRFAGIEYTSIELPVGFRYYMFLNEDSKLFLNLSYMFYDLKINSYAKFNEQGEELELGNQGNFIIGGGYKFKKRYSVEVRYEFTRDALNQYLSIKGNYQSFGINFGYSIIHK